tara:strand:- start:251 stop:484 length:234 start_codon:yes stop_codon:yes gene_type:complete
MFKLVRRNLSVALKQEHLEIENKNLVIINYFKNNIKNNYCSICDLCKGYGYTKSNNLNIYFDFGYEKCYKCNGTGLN